jgi:hypothetical protein
MSCSRRPSRLSRDSSHVIVQKCQSYHHQNNFEIMQISGNKYSPHSRAMSCIIPSRKFVCNCHIALPLLLVGLLNFLFWIVFLRSSPSTPPHPQTKTNTAIHFTKMKHEIAIHKEHQKGNISIKVNKNIWNTIFINSKQT